MIDQCYGITLSVRNTRLQEMTEVQHAVERILLASSGIGLLI